VIVVGGCRERELARTTPQMDIKPEFWMRVLLLDDAKACVLKVSSSFAILDPEANRTVPRYRDDQVGAPTAVEISAGKITIAGRIFTGGEVIIWPDAPHILNVNGDDYRGKVKFVLNSDGSSFDAVNLVPVEPYLAGVVGAEMPDYWEPAALRAQAIAARTYCLHIKNHFGVKRSWDVKRTAANQVYLGVKAESAQTWKAVNETQGQVLVCRQSDGGEAIFPTYYSSTCGGHTEDSKNVFGDSFGPLAGVRCPYCKDVAKPSFFFWPTAEFDKADVANRLARKYPKLKASGEIKDITSAKQSNYGDFSRLTLVKLMGSAGKSNFVRAEDLRLTIDPTGNRLKSTICQIIDTGDKWAFLAGRGYGHGVGMCQCGAQGMARKGKATEQILSHYYPGSKIIRVY
jgi:stage II sporulation protein D